MAMNRSSQELAMREALTEWGRRKIHEARIVHELVVGDRRADMAFIQPRCLILVEIKSDRDKIDRLHEQIVAFRSAAPLAMLALAPGWFNAESLDPWRYRVPILRVAPGEPEPVTRSPRGYDMEADPRVTVQMLDLLWHSELTAIASRRGLLIGKARVNVPVLVGRIARALTGDEIVAEVCRELRARDAFPKVPASDPPIIIAGPTP